MSLNKVPFDLFKGLPVFRASPSSDYNLSPSSNVPMPLQTISIDTLGGTPALNSYSIGNNGFYLVIANHSQSKTAASNNSDAYIVINGSGVTQQYHASTVSGTGHSISSLHYLEAGDTVGAQVRAIGYTGTAIASRTSLSIIRVA